MTTYRPKRPRYFSSPNHAGSMKENTNNELEHLTGDLFYNNNRGGKHTKSRVIQIRNVMCKERKHLTALLNRLGPRTHTHPKRNWTPWVYFGPQPGRGTCPASCGLFELVRWRDSYPPPTTPHQAPGTKNGATDASQHGRRRSKSPPDCRPSAVATKTPVCRKTCSSRPLCSRHDHSAEPSSTKPIAPNDCSPLDLSFPSPAGRGKCSEVLASRLDEGLSGDSWPPLIGRAHGGRREPHPCT